MKKCGFAFLESLIAIVVLTSSLLLLYNTFKRILQSQEQKKYDDQIIYIYRSEYIKDLIYNDDFKNSINNLNDNDGYIEIDKNNYNSLFYNNLFKDYEVISLVLIKTSELKNLKTCLYSDSCHLDISSSFKNYLKRINININADNILAIEYKTCYHNCHNYYSWVSV